MAARQADVFVHQADGQGLGDRYAEGRHPWLLTQTRRLACAARYGCLTEIDTRQQKSLIARFNELTADRGLRATARDHQALRNGESGLPANRRTRRESVGGHEQHRPAFIIDPAAAGELPAMISQRAGARAYLLADEHKNRLMHVYGLGWQFFDGQRWQTITSAKVNQATLALLREEKLDATSQLAALDKESPRPGSSLSCAPATVRVGQRHQRHHCTDRIAARHRSNGQATRRRPVPAQRAERHAEPRDARDSTAQRC